MKIYLKGFSLPELLVVMIIITALSSSLTSSGFYHFYKRWRIRHDLDVHLSSMISLINRARIFAIQSGSSMMLCGGDSCDGQWSEALYLRNKTVQENVEFHLFPDNIRVIWRGFPAARHYLLFLPTGLSSYQNGSFYLCMEDIEARRIIINQSGRAYLDDQLYEGESCN